jgi:Uma2 family endonuclease
MLLSEPMSIAWPPLLERTTLGSARALSMEEWIELDEDEGGELVNGLLQEEEVPDPVHELAVSWIIGVLRAWLSGQGFVFGSELKLLVSTRTGRKPDVTVILPGSPPPARRGPLAQPPDLVVEIVTPSPRDERRDRVEKMSEYAAFGVPHYWLIDPALGTFEMFERGPAGYTQVVAVTSGRIQRVPGCRGLSIDVDALWTELARLG